jgi:hypothetical protein
MNWISFIIIYLYLYYTIKKYYFIFSYLVVIIIILDFVRKSNLEAIKQYNINALLILFKYITWMHFDLSWSHSFYSNKKLVNSWQIEWNSPWNK